MTKFKEYYYNLSKLIIFYLNYEQYCKLAIIVKSNEAIILNIRHKAYMVLNLILLILMYFRILYKKIFINSFTCNKNVIIIIRSKQKLFKKIGNLNLKKISMILKNFK